VLETQLVSDKIFGSTENFSQPIRVLMITSEWPTKDHPEWVPFLVRQVESLQIAGVDVQVFPFRGGKNPWNYLKAWVQLRKQFLFSDYDLLHAQFGQSGLVALPAPIPVVVTFHGSDLQGYIGKHGRQTLSGKILKLMSKFIAELAKEIIVVSDDLAKEINRIPHLIPCGVDINNFSPIEKNLARKQLNWPINENIVLFIGNPDNPIKRYSLANNVINLVQKNINCSLFTVTGVKHQEMPLYLNAGDVLLVTSKHEGSPTIIKEALACNLPVVSVDVGDIRQRLKGIDGCVVCENDTPRVIAKQLERVLLKNQRTNSRAEIKDLDESLIAQRIINVYFSVLS